MLPFLLSLVPVNAEDLPIARSQEGRYYTLVEVEGLGTHAFMLDSGASKTAVYRRFTWFNDVESADYKTSRVMTAAGIAHYPLYRIPPITIGQNSRNFKEMVVLPDADDRRIMGIVGADFFKGHWLSFDSNKNTVRLENTSVKVPDGWQKLKCKPVGSGSMSALVKVGDLDVHAVVDTGATISVLNEFAANALELPTGAKYVKLGADASGHGKSILGSAAKLPAMTIGGISLEARTVYVADLPAFTRFGAHQVPAMIMGMDIMKQFSILLNFDERCLYVQASS